ncbi:MULTISPECIES: DUF3106 domain-containing protein [unclassified Paludibacterium]|uniref:DUF3106 domain-containing protein n=1 Tax=unclassified Paludibacterium TaxID=2618429 RepID=UPI001C044A65|nr:DUF3106 domain-containing protein [Paludibacterium sp. B53371]BEV72897.1 hypothetical protein THUN1379_23790 [Paludibacterium sp. THUN1379]
MIKRSLLLVWLLWAGLCGAQPVSPQWSELTAHQQTVLAPVSSDWNRFAPAHKQRLLAMVPAYDRLSPAAQQRLQRRLKSWAELPEEQQALARLNWLSLQAMTPAQRADVLAKLQATAAPGASAP